MLIYYLTRFLLSLVDIQAGENLRAPDYIIDSTTFDGYYHLQEKHPSSFIQLIPEDFFSDKLASAKSEGTIKS